jgi:predicted Zn-dependent peptidase
MRKRFLSIGCLLLFVVASTLYAGNVPTYTTVPNDPMHTRIYTLSNGLKVYLTVNKLKPRIQTYIAVHVGGKNDPAETTGLSHYLEHLMFKGTTHFGTSNYSVEKPLLDQIRQLYEVYRHTTDAGQRKAIYHRIDSISYEASKYSIPNEYDKLMTSIGSQNSNAYTSEDCTVYQENIPSNQIENWAKIQSERFANAVIRGFHTELEAVYEEFNIGLSNDDEKMFDSLMAGLYPHHPYGKQTVIGTQEHLKNPSIVNIDNHFHTFYVPNNMAICMSGDFDPDATIAIIDRYFSVLTPNPSLPKLDYSAETPLTKPLVKKVIGPQTPMIALAWRFPARHSMANDTLSVADMVLSNGNAGLIDIDINQAQKMVSCQGGADPMADYSLYYMIGIPKEGQTLDQVKDIMLQEIAKLKKGEFSESILKGSMNQFKLQKMQRLESNEARASMFVESFTKDVPWADEVNMLDRLSKINKADVVKFANRYFGDNNYVVVYKEMGKDSLQKKIDKPAISPILTNRDKQSDFLNSITTSTVQPIEPVFVDFNKDLTKTTAEKGLPLYYKKNVINDMFSVAYNFERGSNNDKYLPLAFDYLDYLGTAKMSNTEFKTKMYNLGCRFYVHCMDDMVNINIGGLSENMKEAMTLVDNLLAGAVVDKEAFTKMVKNEIKSRSDDKLDQRMNADKLFRYVTFNGAPEKNVVSNEEMNALNPQKLVDKIHHLCSYKHNIIYYGPMDKSMAVNTINATHHLPQTMLPLPKEVVYKYADVKENKVFIAPYDAKNIYMRMISSQANNLFTPELQPAVSLYNQYFGGSMNSIVFQELRESRALAYNAWATYNRPARKGQPYLLQAHIISQVDKTKDCMSAFQQILNNMPVSQSAFDLAKQGLLSQLRSNRTTGMGVIEAYLSAQRLGINYDINKLVFDKVQSMTFNDLLNFQKKYVRGLNYHTAILGNEKELDMNYIAKYGSIVRLTTKDIFGY